MKNLALVFKTNGTSTLTINLPNHRDDLTLDEAKLAAAKMVPVLITNGGVDVTDLEKAAIVTTSEEELA